MWWPSSPCPPLRQRQSLVGVGAGPGSPQAAQRWLGQHPCPTGCTAHGVGPVAMAWWAVLSNHSLGPNGPRWRLLDKNPTPRSASGNVEGACNTTVPVAHDETHDAALHGAQHRLTVKVHVLVINGVIYVIMGYAMFSPDWALFSFQHLQALDKIKTC